MKILMVVPAIAAIYGGPSQVVLQLARSLGRLGIEVDIVTTSANGNSHLDVPLYRWIDRDFYRIQYFDFWNFGDYRYISFKLTQWLWYRVRAYDIVHTHALFCYPSLPAHWACQQHNVPYVMTPHGMLEPWAMAYKYWKKWLFFKGLEQPAIDRAAAVQALCESEADRARSIAPKTPAIVIPSGIDRADFDRLPDPERFYRVFPETRHKTLILFLGRLHPKKGLDLLASALPQIRAELPQIHVVVAGPDSIGYLPKIKSFFKKVGALDAVTFTGMLQGELKYAALAATDLYISPSYSEGFSLSVLEGMASGLPCVITKGCHFPEAASDRAVWEINPDPVEIAEATIALLKDRRLAREMGDRARQLIFAEYTWERIADRLRSLYLTLGDRDRLSRSVRQLIL
ncbi:glycosyltransferase [Oxynema aestuarii]|uniref:Glycosyltransferase n=1 Tax=Oxynema aestuarii AP17 TaxID=2064643 RepID=A0A6H1U1E5_9CYAN|nr:glycosyltransferase [Oxynema aestuarii]QIZ72475.1 glycosyltransferase [Oxynema aestuarii AP17]